jgi:hypothetical protein
VGMCSLTRNLAMDVSFGFTIPAFRRHVTISFRCTSCFMIYTSSFNLKILNILAT